MLSLPFWVAQLVRPDGARVKRSTKVPVEGGLFQGESFDEALERSAEFIARSIEVINKHIAAVTKARSLGKGDVSEQEGISVGLDMDPKQRLAELNELKAPMRNAGSMRISATVR